MEWIIDERQKPMISLDDSTPIESLFPFILKALDTYSKKCFDFSSPKQSLINWMNFQIEKGRLPMIVPFRTEDKALWQPKNVSAEEYLQKDIQFLEEGINVINFLVEGESVDINFTFEKIFF